MFPGDPESEVHAVTDPRTASFCVDPNNKQEQLALLQEDNDSNQEEIVTLQEATEAAELMKDVVAKLSDLTDQDDSSPPGSSDACTMNVLEEDEESRLVKRWDEQVHKESDCIIRYVGDDIGVITSNPSTSTSTQGIKTYSMKEKDEKALKVDDCMVVIDNPQPKDGIACVSIRKQAETVATVATCHEYKRSHKHKESDKDIEESYCILTDNADDNDSDDVDYIIEENTDIVTIDDSDDDDFPTEVIPPVNDTVVIHEKVTKSSTPSVNPAAQNSLVTHEKNQERFKCYSHH